MRRSVDDCKFPIEFYQQALITTFVMGIKDDNVMTELLKRDYESYSDRVESANTLTSTQDASSNNSTKQIFNAVGWVLVLGVEGTTSIKTVTSQIPFAINANARDTYQRSLR